MTTDSEALRLNGTPSMYYNPLPENFQHDVTPSYYDDDRVAWRFSVPSFD